MSVFLYPQLPNYIDVRSVEPQRLYHDFIGYTNELKFLLEQRDFAEQLRPATKFYPQTTVTDIPSPNEGDIAYSTSSGKFWGYVDSVRWEPFNSGIGGARGYYGTFYTDSTMSVVSANQPVVVSLSYTNGSFGVTLQNGTQVKVLNSGVYNIQFSAQFLNNDTKLIDAKTWFKRNGTNIEYTGGYAAIPERHGGGDGKLIVAYNIMVSLSANDYVEAYFTATSVGVYIADISSTGVIPNSPAFILTIQQV